MVYASEATTCSAVCSRQLNTAGTTLGTYLEVEEKKKKKKRKRKRKKKKRKRKRPLIDKIFSISHSRLF